MKKSKNRILHKKMRLLNIFIIFVIPLISAQNPQKLIYINDIPILVEIANNQISRQNGLMFRKSLDRNRGMLFIFEKEEYLSFWMKNTYIPLSIGYFNKNKILIDIFDMKVNQTTELYHSSKAVLYALEVNKGWFLDHNIESGAKLKFNK